MRIAASRSASARASGAAISRGSARASASALEREARALEIGEAMELWRLERLWTWSVARARAHFTRGGEARRAQFTHSRGGSGGNWPHAEECSALSQHKGKLAQEAQAAAAALLTKLT